MKYRRAGKVPLCQYVRPVRATPCLLPLGLDTVRRCVAIDVPSALDNTHTCAQFPLVAPPYHLIPGYDILVSLVPFLIGFIEVERDSKGSRPCKGRCKKLHISD